MVDKDKLLEQHIDKNIHGFGWKSQIIYYNYETGNWNPPVVQNFDLKKGWHPTWWKIPVGCMDEFIAPNTAAAQDLKRRVEEMSVAQGYSLVAILMGVKYRPRHLWNNPWNGKTFFVAPQWGGDWVSSCDPAAVLCSAVFRNSKSGDLVPFADVWQKIDTDLIAGSGLADLTGRVAYTKAAQLFAKANCTMLVEGLLRAKTK